MNIRGAAGCGGGPGSPADAVHSAALLDVGRKTLAMDGVQPAFRTSGPSPVAHNGRHWTPDRRREDAETVRYIRRLVQTCEAIRPWTVANRSPSSPPPRANVTMDRLPRVMQQVLGNKIQNKDHRSVSPWTPSDFVKDCLFWHNFYRHFHRSPDLVLSPHLCEEAQSWANRLAHTDTFAYQNKVIYGQNVFCRTQTDRTIEIEGRDVVREWYSSSKVFKPRQNPKMYSANINSGPFTQLVWSDTRELGVGRACSRSGRAFVVANYHPKGNVNGKYAENVHANRHFLPADKKTLCDAVSSRNREGTTTDSESVYCVDACSKH